MPAHVTRSSPSFLIAVGLLIVVAGGYVAWRWLKPPTPRALSERIVRQFTKDVAAEVGAYRKQVRLITARAEDGEMAVAAATEQIENKAREAVARVKNLTDEASARIEEIEELRWKAMQNRLDRIRQRAQETREYIAEIEAAAKAELEDSKG
jgi:predicted ATP-dependent protease